MSAAELNLEMISENLVQSGIDLVRDPRIAFAELVSARERADRNVRLSELLNEVAELTGRLQAAGDISELDTKLVQLDAVNSASLAARSMQEIDVAELRLRTLMGAKDALPKIKVVQSDTILESPPSEDMLVELALQSRPGLRAAELAIRAAGERAGWEKSRVFNMVSAGLSSKEIGDSGF